MFRLTRDSKENDKVEVWRRTETIKHKEERITKQLKHSEKKEKVSNGGATIKYLPS